MDAWHDVSVCGFPIGGDEDESGAGSRIVPAV